MRRAIAAVAGTVAGLVLLLSFKTHGPAPGSGPAAAVVAGGRGVTGAAEATRFGPVQVRITVAGGRLQAVTVTRYPAGDPRSQQLSAYAIPVLNAEAVAAGDADIDLVSGATYTSTGYLASLQSALTTAGLA